MGSFSNAPTDTKIVSSNKVIESVSLLYKNTAGKYVVNVDWKAPSSDVGVILFHSIMLASDGDGSESGDDVSSPGLYSIKYQKNGTDVDDIIDNRTSVNAYPNPITNVLTVEMSDADVGTYNIQVINTNGVLVASEKIDVIAENHKFIFDSAAWSPGIYFITINNNSYKRTITLVKE